MNPTTLSKNIEMIENAGFTTHDIFFKYNNFVGLVAIKETNNDR